MEVQRLNESLELLRMERDSVNAENHRLMNAVSDAASASGSQGSGDGKHTVMDVARRYYCPSVVGSRFCIVLDIVVPGGRLSILSLLIAIVLF